MFFSDEKNRDGGNLYSKLDITKPGKYLHFLRLMTIMSFYPQTIESCLYLLHPSDPESGGMHEKKINYNSNYKHREGMHLRQQ